MKLQRLAGFGPVAAFISAIALLVIGVINYAPITPSVFVPAFITFLAAFVIWTGSLTITLFDLEWLEHPATSTPTIRVALVAILVAMVMPAVLALIVFAGTPIPIAIPWTVLFLGVGVSLLMHNLEARRTKLLHGALPWIGIVAGSFLIYLAILQFVFMFTPKLVMGFYYGLPVTQLTYVVWAVWMGIHLIRSRSRAKAPTQVAATA